jgi:hypothetical protein
MVPLFTLVGFIDLLAWPILKSLEYLECFTLGIIMRGKK